jgi:2-oxoisovalerate dehydrogenase E1 component alpha subunit
VVYAYYRSVPLALARGFSVREVFLDYLGKAGGPSSGGKNIPGHWAKRALRMMTVSGSVATQIPHAVGSALAARRRGEDSVAIAYFGDGGSSKSDFHEGLNFAAVHRLPCIFFCENNQYAISVPFRLQSPVPSVADRAVIYNLPGVSIDGMDAFEVYRATREAVERARRGEGPTLIEARVYRYSLHTSHVGIENYRSADEINEWRQRDPIPRLRRYLEEVGLLDEARDRELAQRIAAELDDAIAFAEAAPYPPVAAAFADLYRT